MTTVPRVGDHIGLGVIAKSFPPDLAQTASRFRWVQRVLAEAGQASERKRALPAQVMVCYAIAVALCMGSSTHDFWAGTQRFSTSWRTFGKAVPSLRCGGRRTTAAELQPGRNG